MQEAEVARRHQLGLGERTAAWKEVAIGPDIEVEVELVLLHVHNCQVRV